MSVVNNLNEERLATYLETQVGGFTGRLTALSFLAASLTPHLRLMLRRVPTCCAASHQVNY
jgi:hypothetical protein